MFAFGEYAQFCVLVFGYVCFGDSNFYCFFEILVDFYVLDLEFARFYLGVPLRSGFCGIKSGFDFSVQSLRTPNPFQD